MYNLIVAEYKQNLPHVNQPASLWSYMLQPRITTPSVRRSKSKWQAGQERGR